MPFRVTAQLADPPGGVQIYAWPNTSADTNTIRLPDELKWQPATGDEFKSRGHFAWVPTDAVETLSPELQTAIHRYLNPPPPWTVRDRTFDWGSQTYIMGVLNVTPDSFSDGGQFNTVERAVNQARHLIDAGADMLDIGGESSRPGAESVSLEDEVARVVPVIRALREWTSIPISIDTTKAAVLEAAIGAGADILNDISAGLVDSDMLPTAARLEVPVFLMHMQGTPRTMQANPSYGNVIDDVYDYFVDRIEAAETAGISRSKISIDTGIGFGKTVEHNLSLIARGAEFRSLGCPMLIGVSRKSFIGKILDKPDPSDRVWGTGAACAVAIEQSADILRVHDVAEIADISRICDRLRR